MISRVNDFKGLFIHYLMGFAPRARKGKGHARQIKNFSPARLRGGTDSCNIMH
jgi:hypothetical protein